MRSIRADKRATLVAILAAAVTGQAAARTGPAGPEFQVNTYTTSHQNDPVVAENESGSFVVVWSSNSQDGDGQGIFGQRFDSAGSPQGSEFQVNSYTTSNQTYPAVAVDDSGSS
jgi:large repetitive protein